MTKSNNWKDRLSSLNDKSRKYTVSYHKNCYIHFDVEASNKAEAIEKADATEEKFGTVVQSPYFVAAVQEHPWAMKSTDDEESERYLELS